MKTEDTRAEITYLPQGSSASFVEAEDRYLDKLPEREISIGYVLDILRRRRKIVLLGDGIVVLCGPDSCPKAQDLSSFRDAANSAW